MNTTGDAMHPIHPNDGCDTLPRGSRVWHGAYCRWYDHREQGHTLRSRAWSWLADRIVRFA
jgi:hypothetical protein